MKLTSDERMQYGKEVWETFQIVANTGRDASSAEWDMIRRWMDRGIPLPVVLRGIEETAKPRTLLACEKPVEAAISYWAKAVGGLTELPKAGPLEEIPL